MIIALIMLFDITRSSWSNNISYRNQITRVQLVDFEGFYRTMHFSAKRRLAIACRLSVRPSVCLSVRL